MNGRLDGPLFAAGMPRVAAFAPGRTELAGNHVDHQHGCVMSAAVSLGIRAEAAENGMDVARVESAGFGSMAVDIRDTAPRENEHNTAISLVRGMIACFREAGVPVGGFDVRASSTLPAGGGLSSSAAFEMLIGQILNLLFAHGSMDAMTLAQWGKRVECGWFDKPCGLQDQAIVAHGGIALMDFSDPAHPALTPVSFDFGDAGYAVILVDTHCDHSLHAEAFSRIPADMQRVARFFGKEVLGQVDPAAFYRELPSVRTAAGDAATLRALHFFHEEDLVMRRLRALREGDMASFLKWTNASGVSSAQYLQNVSLGGREQPAAIALALADIVLDGRGAFRIHGGGFGGTIQAFVPLDLVSEFCARMDGWLGAGSCLDLPIGAAGAMASWQR